MAMSWLVSVHFISRSKVSFGTKHNTASRIQACKLDQHKSGGIWVSGMQDAAAHGPSFKDSIVAVRDIE